MADSTPEEVQAVVEQILKADLSSDQAEQLVASAEVLTSITGSQAQELFEQIEPAQLSESMASVIADTMNNPDVPYEVKEAFEDTLNIFGNDGFSIYVPLGSNVNVAVRRTIIAGTTILVALPSPAPASAAAFQISNSGAITLAPVITPNALVRNNAIILPATS